MCTQVCAHVSAIAKQVQKRQESGLKEPQIYVEKEKLVPGQVRESLRTEQVHSGLPTRTTYFSEVVQVSCLPPDIFIWKDFRLTRTAGRQAYPGALVGAHLCEHFSTKVSPLFPAHRDTML